VPVLNWQSVASSADGIKLAAVANHLGLGGIYVSTNSGATWMLSNASIQTGQAIACSADGSRLVVAGEIHTRLPAYFFIYISTNSGTAWITNIVDLPPMLYWSASVACSADGPRIAAVSSYIYTSTNSGATWQSNNVNVVSPNWRGIATSSDGNRLVAVSLGGGTYTSFSAPSPSLKFIGTGGGLGLSWTVPSTNFILLQTSDLSAPDWMPVSDVPVLNLTNLQNQVFISPTGASGFYRLATP